MNITKPAVLLIGPTGSGKTPLGNFIETNGLWDRTFAHFDFGELLRQTVAQSWDCAMSPVDLSKLKTILEEGALLEADTFYLAEQVITHFNKSTKAGYILLNGLPRHLGQAADIAPYFKVESVIYLECSPEVVIERIASNTGTDRTNRTDDAIELVKKKLLTFTQRTAPLVAHYQEQGARVMNVIVQTDTQPEDIVNALIPE